MSEAASKITTVILTTGDLEKVDRLAEAEDRGRRNMLRKLIRDASSLCAKRIMQSSGDYYIEYDLTINYRNIELMFWIGGYEKDFDQSFAEDIAKVQFGKLQSLPLSESVNWAP
ncbi:MAG: hypothetical protein NTU91_13360 [Chloroflexi bacterium]|nr:hypothetical protein [Chloroflexota bacterium]